MMGLTSLYLFSALGVEGNYNNMIGLVGVMGSLSAGIATIIGMFAQSRTHYEHQQSETAKAPQYQQSTRKLSISEANDAAIFGGLI